MKDKCDHGVPIDEDCEKCRGLLTQMKQHQAARSSEPIACADRMPPERQYVLMWETPSLRWSVGCWYPEYQKWGNRDDREYAIHPHQVSHWMPLPEPIR